MEPNRAADDLQTIRTLMERASLYRRALAPVMALAGLGGIAAGALGLIAGAEDWTDLAGAPRGFALYWMSVAGLILAGAYAIARRQAIREGERFWSPPTRRVTRALAPGLAAGLVMGLVAGLPGWREPAQMWFLPPAWMILYGVQFHAAGFFLPSGSQRFGWLFILAGCGFLAFINHLSYSSFLPPLAWAHGLMGGVFGGLHLAYAALLCRAERKRRAP